MYGISLWDISLVTSGMGMDDTFYLSSVFLSETVLSTYIKIESWGSLK